MIAFLGSRSITEEISSTTMGQVEQKLIARLMAPASNDLFFIGGISVSVPCIPNAEKHSNLRKAFRASQAHTDMIWQENIYLHGVQKIS